MWKNSLTWSRTFLSRASSCCTSPAWLVAFATSHLSRSRSASSCSMCCCFSFRASCSAVVPEIFRAYRADVSVSWGMTTDVLSHVLSNCCPQQRSVMTHRFPSASLHTHTGTCEDATTSELWVLPVLLGWVCRWSRRWRSSVSWRRKHLGSSSGWTSSASSWPWWVSCRGSQYESLCGPGQTDHTWACTGSIWEENRFQNRRLKPAGVSLCQRSLLHLVPATAPSFLPRGSSSSTPHHSPLAKSVSPRKRTTPALVPPTCT